MTKLIEKLRKPKFTDRDGNVWKYVGYERDTFFMTAIYESVSAPQKFIYLEEEFTYQEGETVSGWEYPEHRSYRINPGESGYDYDRAVMEALDETHAKVQEGRFSHAA